MNRLIFGLLLAFSCTLSVTAQSTTVIRIATVSLETNEALVCVPIIADTFPDNIAAMQFSIGWDEDELDFAEIQLGENPFNFAANDVGRSLTSDSNVDVNYVTETAQGIDIAPETVMLNICFSRENRPAGSGQLTFSGMNVPEFGDETTFMAQPFDTIPGSLTYTEGSVGIFTPSATEPDWASRVNIYPNPYTNGPIKITGEDLPRFDAVNVFDMEGRTVRHFKGDVRKFNLAALPRGEFAIQLMVEGVSVTRSIVKQ